MIFTESVNFIYVILFILLFNILRRFTNKVELLNFILLCGSVLIINVLTHLQSTIVLIGVSTLIYFTGLYLSRNRDKIIILYLLIILLLGLFILKNYEATRLSIVDRLGLSYILFRLIHFLVDSAKNKIKKYDLLRFINYILFFPTFIAGPIDRYQNFSYWINQDRNYYKTALIKMGIFKLALGVIKKYFFVPQLAAYATDFSQFSGVMSWQNSLLVSLVIYSFYILFDFSGYSDIAIGTAYLIGVRTPENFNWPYLAKNISIFWKKWHITLSSFLFEYIYKPFVTRLSNYFQTAPRLLISCLGYLTTFLICGAWHGTAGNFIFWGLWHGVGLCSYKILTPYWPNFSNKFYQSLSTGISALMTFLFVTMGWFFFNYKSDAIASIAKNFCSSNEKYFSVKAINYLGHYGYRLNFEPGGSDSLIDIEFGTPKGPLITISYQQRNKSGEYYLVPEKLDQKLYVIKIRSRSNNQVGKWFTEITSYDGRQKEQTFIQSKLFGTRVKPDVIRADEDMVLSENRLQLPLKLAVQKIDSKANYFDNYGWGIRIYYLADFLSKVDVEYRYGNSKVWERVQTGRSGKYNFCDIHGSLPAGVTTRNLLPGKYYVRMRYEYELKKSTWFEGTATIPDY